VSVGLLVRFLHRGWPEVADALSGLTTAPPLLVGAVVGLEVVWMLCLAQVYRSALLSFGGEARRRSALRITMSAYTLSRVLPGGGATGSVFAARELVNLGNPVPLTVLSMAVSWCISMTALAALVVAGTAPAAAAGTIPWSYLAVPSLLLAAFLVGGVVAGRLLPSSRMQWRVARLLQRAADRFGTVGSREAEWSIDAAAIGLRSPRLLGVAGWALAAWICDAAALAVSVVALGHPLDIGVLLVGYGLVNLLSALPELTPGWLGVLETTLTVAYAAFGVPVGVAVAAVLLYRLVSYWLPVAAGVPFAIGTIRSLRPTRRARPSRQVQPIPEQMAA
jgi:hypothetical protein